MAFYSGKHSVFRVARPNKHTDGMTQFGRALAELNVEILCANSSQAKGRVERANRTLQDRLVKEMRLGGISDIAAGNAFLPGFVERHNARFAKTPARLENLHRPLEDGPDRLAEILCLRDQRYVTQELTLKHDRRRIVLEVNDLTRDLPGRYVDTYEFPDGRLQIRVKGMVVPFTAYDPDQRVGQAAITENKHLGAALAHIKAEQDARPPRCAPAPRAPGAATSPRAGATTTGTPSWPGVRWPDRPLRLPPARPIRAPIREVCGPIGRARPHRPVSLLLGENGDAFALLPQRYEQVGFYSEA